MVTDHRAISDADVKTNTGCETPGSRLILYLSFSTGDPVLMSRRKGPKMGVKNVKCDDGKNLDNICSFCPIINNIIFQMLT